MSDKKNYIEVDGDGNIILQDIEGENITINNLETIKKAFENSEPEYIKQLYAQIDDNYKQLVKNNEQQLQQIIALLQQQSQEREIKIEKSKNILTGKISNVGRDVHIGDVIYNQLSTEKKDSVNQLIYLKLDRINVSEDLEDILEDILDNEILKPQIIFLPGFLDDKHFLAVKKLAFSILSEFETPVIQLKTEDWDGSANLNKQIKRVRRNILKSVEKYLKDKSINSNSLPKILESGKIITQLPVLKEHILVIEQEIDVAIWNNHTLDALKWYFNDFWNFELTEVIKPTFIFLNIVYGKEKILSANLIQKVISDIENLIKSVELSSIERFSELSELNRGHIERFFEDLEIYDAQNFIQDGQKMRMAQVLPQLRGILAGKKINIDDDAIANM